MCPLLSECSVDLEVDGHEPLPSVDVNVDGHVFCSVLLASAKADAYVMRSVRTSPEAISITRTAWLFVSATYTWVDDADRPPGS